VARQPSRLRKDSEMSVGIIRKFEGVGVKSGVYDCIEFENRRFMEESVHDCVDRQLDEYEIFRDMETLAIPHFKIFNVM